MQEDAAFGERSTGKPMQLDVFLPAQRLAFEYQGAQHYSGLDVFRAHDVTAAKDREKADALAAHNITLVEVPHWWQDDTFALKKTIARVRPDLLAA